MQLIQGFVWLVFAGVAVSARFREQRVTFILILWFFFSCGFQLVPPSLFESSIGLTKAADYGIVALVFVLLARGRVPLAAWKADSFARILGVFLGFVGIAAAYSLFIVGIEVASVVRSCRYFLILLAYFEFKRLQPGEFSRLLTYLKRITVLQSILFLVQFPLDTAILNTGLFVSEVQELQIGGLSMPRFYSFPLLGPFFLFHTLIQPRVRLSDIPVVFLVVAPLVLPLHRSWIFALALSGAVALVRSRVSVKRTLALGFCLVLPVVMLFQERLESGVRDFLAAVSGGYDMAELTEDNLSFRLAHVLERGMFVLSSPERIVFGSGMITEESARAQQLEFVIGYKGEDGVVLQVDMGDIAWSTLLLRFGVLGTLLFLMVYLRATWLLWRPRGSGINTSAVAYLVMFLITSLTSSVLIEPHGLVALSMFVGTAATWRQDDREAKPESGMRENASERS